LQSPVDIVLDIATVLGHLLIDTFAGYAMVAAV
jgi:hypothetical protein